MSACNPGSGHGQVGEWMPLLYDRLRRLAAQRLRTERRNHTLQPTALVNEVYLKLAQQRRLDVQSRTHFMALAATAIREILVDQARAKRAQKRGGGYVFVSLDDGLQTGHEAPENILELHAAIERLGAYDARQARVVELCYFGGLTQAEIAHELQVSERLVRDELVHARAWLRNYLASK